MLEVSSVTTRHQASGLDDESIRWALEGVGRARGQLMGEEGDHHAVAIGCRKLQRLGTDKRRETTQVYAFKGYCTGRCGVGYGFAMVDRSQFGVRALLMSGVMCMLVTGARNTRPRAGGQPSCVVFMHRRRHARHQCLPRQHQ